MIADTGHQTLRKMAQMVEAGTLDPMALVGAVLRYADERDQVAPAACDHEPPPEIAESVARLAAAGQITSAQRLLHTNSRLTWDEVVARVELLAGKAVQP